MNCWKIDDKDDEEAKYDEVSQVTWPWESVRNKLK